MPSVLYRYIYSKVGNREEAEELTSQVYLKALRGLDETRDANAPQAWLFQVARTTIADYWRGFYRLRAGSLDDLLAAGWDSPATTGEPASDQSAATRAAAQILSQLPERYREVLSYTVSAELVAERDGGADESDRSERQGVTVSGAEKS